MTAHRSTGSHRNFVLGTGYRGVRARGGIKREGGSSSSTTTNKGRGGKTFSSYTLSGSFNAGQAGQYHGYTT